MTTLGEVVSGEKFLHEKKEEMERRKGEKSSDLKRTLLLRTVMLVLKNRSGSK